MVRTDLNLWTIKSLVKIDVITRFYMCEPSESQRIQPFYNKIAPIITGSYEVRSETPQAI